MKTTIRKANLSDSAKILPLWIQLMELHANESVIFKPITNYKTKVIEDIKRLINQPTVTIFVAENNNSIVAYCMVTISSRPSIFIKTKKAYIGDTIVSTTMQRQGIGTMLITHIMSWFKEQGIEFVDLQVTKTNEKGKQFWEKCGFKTVNYYMVKDLSE